LDTGTAARRVVGPVASLLLSLGVPGADWADRLVTDSADVLTNQASVDAHAPTGGDDLDGLKPQMRTIVDRARSQAAAANVDLRIVSAYRSRSEQQSIWEFSVGKYGSEQAAIRWVLPPGLSAHVTGEAIDVTPRSAATWLEAHSATLGLCRRYANEWWHFERTASMPGGTCRLEPFAGWLVAD
jgi:LAS superfamily LD-carboxypeptidase LdcB